MGLTIDIPVFDVLDFPNKPDLGMLQDLSFIHEWEATHKDDIGSSSYTIEEPEFIQVALSRKEYEYIVIDIEGIETYHDPLAKLYVEIAQAAAHRSKISWWNTTPYNADLIVRREDWSGRWQLRKPLVDSLDFGIFSAYFKQSDTIESWGERHLPKIVEARKLYNKKPLFITLSPHIFDNGKPWGHVSSGLLGGAMDAAASYLIDGVVLWSQEGTGQTQTWDENWPWVQELRDRIGSEGNYQMPAA